MTPDFTKEANNLIDKLYDDIFMVVCGELDVDANAARAVIIKAISAAYNRGIEASIEAARNHECGGKDDFICQGINCKDLIIEAIRSLAKSEGA